MFGKKYDISQEVFSCEIYPGDPKPEKQSLAHISEGDLYNLSAFSMCAHNGTHVDAPYHFVNSGKKVDEIPLEHFIGMAYVSEHEGSVTGEDAARILGRAREFANGCHKRILIKGNAEITIEAATVFAKEGILLLGNESQTVGPEDAPMAVHKVLLDHEIVLLEGIRLQHVPEGAYMLNAAPLNLSGFDGAPCRAILIECM